MRYREHRHAHSHLALGLVVLAIGIILTLGNLDIIRVRDVFYYWPVLFIIYGLVRLLQPEDRSGRILGVIAIFIGTALLLDRLYLLPFSLWAYWPIIIVFIGASIIWRAFERREVPISRLADGTSLPDGNSTVRAFAFMGGIKRNINSRDFRGGELTAVMGGCEIDLRNASIESGDAIIDVFAFWGGVEIRVPMDWTVIVDATPLLGGFDDKTRPPETPSKKRLVLKGYAIMGGVEISN
jgi:predicted membrane protein